MTTPDVTQDSEESGDEEDEEDLENVPGSCRNIRTRFENSVQRRQMSARLSVWTTQYLRRCCGKCRHPWLEKPQPKSERVFADENKIDELKHGELVEKDASHNRHDEVAQLRHDQHQILDAQNLGADYAANSDGWNPKKKRCH